MELIKTEPEFSRRIELVCIPDSGLKKRVKASLAECRLLANRFGVSSISNLTAEVEAKSIDSHSYLVSVAFQVEVVQLCVVSLNPVRSRVNERFEVKVKNCFLEAASDVFIDMGDEDPPEQLDEGGVDVGELIAQHLLLCIDPYRRIENSECYGKISQNISYDGQPALEKEVKVGAFSALSTLLRKD